MGGAVGKAEPRNARDARAQLPYAEQRHPFYYGRCSGRTVVTYYEEDGNLPFTTGVSRLHHRHALARLVHCHRLCKWNVVARAVNDARLFRTARGTPEHPWTRKIDEYHRAHRLLCVEMLEVLLSLPDDVCNAFTVAIVVSEYKKRLAANKRAYDGGRLPKTTMRWIRRRASTLARPTTRPRL